MNEPGQIATTAGGFIYAEAFSRNRGLVTLEEQGRLRNATVAIPGMGGVGGIHLITLARMGIGGFHIADADSFSWSNFNRQYGAVSSTINQSKTEVMENLVRDVNPEVRLRRWDKFIDTEIIDEFLDGCDIAIDSIDAFNIDAKRLLFKRAHERGIPVVGAGPVGFSCVLHVQMPGKMSFDEYFDYKPELSAIDKFARFINGIAPRPYFLSYFDVDRVRADSGAAPSIASSVTLCAGFTAVEVLKILLERQRIYALPYYYYLDPYLMKFKRGYIPFGNKNPLQRLKISYLKSKLGNFRKSSPPSP